MAGRVVKYIRELKPHVVLTHDPIGGYKHPDHIHIHKATKLAFEKADDASFHPEAGLPFKPRALYYQVYSRRWLKLIVRLMRLFGKDPTRYGRNRDVNLLELAEVEFPIHVRLDTSAVKDIKVMASAQHASQGGTQIRRGWMGMMARVFGEREEFMRAYPPVADGKHKISDDLFM